MRRRIREQGSATVEFALVLPLICLMLLATIQAGLAARARVLVAQAAREGARQATTADDNGEIRQAAVLAAGGLASSGLAVDYNAPEGWKCGHPVTVTASYDMPCVFPGLNNIWPGGMRLSERTTMRLEKDR